MVRPSRVRCFEVLTLASEAARLPRQPAGRPRRADRAGSSPSRSLAAEAVVRQRRVVGGEESLACRGRKHEHRHRVVVEQQPERGLALLQVGDVDAQADDAAVAGAAAPRSGCSGRRPAPARAARPGCRAARRRSAIHSSSRPLAAG